MNVAGSDGESMPEDPAFRIKAAMRVDEETAAEVAACAREALKSIAASSQELLREGCSRRARISTMRMDYVPSEHEKVILESGQTVEYFLQRMCEVASVAGG